MTRLIDFGQDADGHWLAILSCGHTQRLWKYRAPSRGCLRAFAARRAAWKVGGV